MKKKKMTVAVISAVLVLTAALCIVPTLAKYITRQGKQSELVSDSFYFTSDYLRADETPEYTVIGDSICNYCSGKALCGHRFGTEPGCNIHYKEQQLHH